MADNDSTLDNNALIYSKDNTPKSAKTCLGINHLESALRLIDLSPIQAFYANPSENKFKEISKKQQTIEMVYLAVQTDPRSFKHVSKKLITPELCMMAVSKDGYVLSMIPENMKTKEMCYLAVQNGAYIDDVPRDYWTKELCLVSIQANGKNIQYIPKSFQNKEMAMAAVEHDITICSFPSTESHYPIHFIAKRLITSDLVKHSIMSVPFSIKDIPTEFCTKELCELAVTVDYRLLICLPESYKTRELYLKILEQNPNAYNLVPSKYASTDVVMGVINSLVEKHYYDNFSLSYINRLRDLLVWIPEQILNETDVFELLLAKVNVNILRECSDIFTERNAQILIHNSSDSCSLLTSSLCLFSTQKTLSIDEDTGNQSLPSTKRRKTIHYLANGELHTNKIYYITDIHIEHQLQKESINGCIEIDELDNFLEKKIKEMIPKDVSYKDILLIGGDVAHTKKIAERFYYILRIKWPGRVIAILGNHELWDDNENFDSPNQRSLEEIISDYEDMISFSDSDLESYWNTKDYDRFKYSSILLFNSVFILYKGIIPRVITEEQILNCTIEELREVLLKSSVVIYGGTGFSGLNTHFNSTHGIYRATIRTLEEDLNQTYRFKNVYDKLMSAADDLQLIVFSHTPFSDWCSESYNPSWVYINGHTHRNTMIREKSGLTVLSDNQIGYEPSKWKLTALSIKGYYDPFAFFSDGIHIISSEQYKDFNNGRGIAIKGCSYDGTIYCLKKSKIYMFLLLYNNTLCLLDGGRRKGLVKGENNIDIQYYYDNMDLYAHILQEVIDPYQKLLEDVSNEVKKFGGKGTIHGCIVDIDFLNHIYVNPMDFKKTPYFAYDISSRKVYSSVNRLLKDNIPQLVNRYKKLESKGILPLLSDISSANKDNNQLSLVPEYVFGTEMYNPSRKMKSLQYLLDNNVIRIWDDIILQHKKLSPETVKEIGSESSET